MGKPIGGMRRFLKKLNLPAGTKYAVLTTEAAPQPDKKTGKVPTEEELAKWQRVRPIINEILQGEGPLRGSAGPEPAPAHQAVAVPVTFAVLLTDGLPAVAGGAVPAADFAVHAVDH